MLTDLRLALGFFTALPSGRHGSPHEVAAAGYLLPLVAVVLGAIEGLIAWGALELFGAIVAAAIVLGSALLLSGFHHTDGLADVGDALMAHGDAARRLEVLKDRNTGAGAVAAMLLTYLITWSALAALIASGEAGVRLVWCLIAVEVAARLALITVAMLCRPSHSGSGSAFMAAMRGWRGFAAIGVSMAALAAPAALPLPLEWTQPALAAAGALAVALIIAMVAKKAFDGANGDVLGATVELGRAGALLGLVGAINLWPL